MRPFISVIVPSAACVLFAASPAFAVKAAAVYGWGANSCGAWSDAREKSLTSADAVEWVLGYVSASNVWAKTNIADGTDAAGMAAWVDGYCAKHPLDSVGTAAQEMLTEMIGERVRLETAK